MIAHGEEQPKYILLSNSVLCNLIKLVLSIEAERENIGNKIREYKNRYWLKNNDVYELHFTQFYDDEIILKFILDKDDSENYIYVSELLNVEHDDILSESIEDAMEQFEDMVIDYIKENIACYEEMLDKFQEE